MEGELDVDVELFIGEIRQLPSIWDVRSDEYKDRIKKQRAWHQLCSNILSGFEMKSEYMYLYRKYENKTFFFFFF